MRSLHSRLLVAVFATSALLLSGLGGGLYLVFRSILVGDFDRLLTAETRAVASQVEQNGSQVRFDPETLQLPEFGTNSTPQRREYFEIWLTNGTVLARSPTLGARDLCGGLPVPDERANRCRLPDGRNGRILVMAFTPTPDIDTPGDVRAVAPAAQSAVVAVASSTAALDRLLLRLRGVLLVLGCGAVVLSCLVLGFSVRRALCPLDDLVRRVEATRGDDRLARLPVSGMPSEFVPLLCRFNELLDRIHTAAARETLFFADVAHELRTPLAGLHTTLQVCRTRPRVASVHEAVADKCLVLTRRMQQMVENLLALARAEREPLPIHRRRIQLDAFLAECWSEFATAATARHLTMRCKVDAALRPCTDPEKLAVLLRGLLDNAVAYTDVGGAIEIGATPVGDGVQMEIANTGSHVAPVDVPHLFERFWRGDPARTDVGTHCGLGLAIVQRMASVLGIEISVTSTMGGWFRVTLRIPPAMEDGGQDELTSVNSLGENLKVAE